MHGADAEKKRGRARRGNRGWIRWNNISRRVARVIAKIGC